MNWLKLTIRIPDEYHELLISELVELDFDGFEQLDNQLQAFITKSNFNDVNREYIEQLLIGLPGDNYIEMEEIRDQNWNESWEQTIQPQEIGRFYVKPTWSRSSIPEDRILLEIDPKMAFGTGYHATTRLMLELLPELKPEGKTVLDVGTGTGILAIAAAKLGAPEILAFDIDAWSVTNAEENILINQVGDRVQIRSGSIESVPEDSRWDLILANINRNVILELLPTFVTHLSDGGHLLLSGLLAEDRKQILHLADEHSLKLEGERSLTEEPKQFEWIALRLAKSP